jgi:hypothetical protein
VSKTYLLRLLAVLALSAAVAWSGRFALAGAMSLQEMLAGALTSSAAPALLGPITSAGRLGWECKPERAAAAASSSQAGLPADPETQ